MLLFPPDKEPSRRDIPDPGKRITVRDHLTPGLQRLGGTLTRLDPHVADERLGDRYWNELIQRFATIHDRVLFLVADEIAQEHMDGYRTCRPRLDEIERMIRRALAAAALLQLLRLRRLNKQPNVGRHGAELHARKLPHRHASNRNKTI